MAFLHGSIETVIVVLLAVFLGAVGVPALILWLVPGLTRRTKWIAFAAMLATFLATWWLIGRTNGVTEKTLFLTPAAMAAAIAIGSRFR